MKFNGSSRARKSKDPVESAIAKAELQRRFPAEYPHLMETLRKEETEKEKVEGSSLRERIVTKVSSAEPVVHVIETPAKKDVAKEVKERKEWMEKGEETDVEVVEKEEESQ